MAQILVVDDESNIRTMLRLALMHVGHTVETAGDGYEGLEKFADGATYNLVLLDQRMPGLEGLEVLREMRTRRPTVPVIMITAFGTVDLVTEAMKAGATDFLRKPFTVETLRGAVAAALAGRHGDAIINPLPVPYAFDLTTVNGFRLRSSTVQIARNTTVNAAFIVQTPDGAEHTCKITVPCYVVELVKAHTDLEEPGGEPFWQALCGEALANYLWQNAALPDGDALTVDDLTSGLRHWIDAVLSAAGK